MFSPDDGGHPGAHHNEMPTIALGGGLAGEPAADGSTALRRHPDWIRSRLPSGDNYHELKGLMRGLSLNTVCEEAHCPNIGECWDQRTATIMILGDTCTRACGFCAVKTGRPTWNDEDEPRRVAEAIAAMNLEHVVVTSVARDDLADGGAHIFAETIRALRRECPGTGEGSAAPSLARGHHPRLPSASDHQCDDGRDNGRREQCAEAQQSDRHGDQRRRLLRRHGQAADVHPRRCVHAQSRQSAGNQQRRARAGVRRRY
jgi:hypothetical protein